MKYIILTSLIISSLCISYAQPTGIPEVEYFSRRDYDGATQNWTISQSSNDIMYAANNSGLLEYDGSSWRLYDQFISGAIRSINCINDKIYTGVHNDFGFFEYDSLQHLTYTSLAISDSLNALGDVWNILQHNDEIVIQTEKALVLVKNDSVIDCIKSKSRFGSCFTANEMLIVSDDKQGLLELRGSTLFPLPATDFFADKDVTSIIALSKTKLLVCTMDNGAFVWDMKSVRKWEVPIIDKLIDENIFSAIRYNEDLLLFGTIQGGLIVSNNKGEMLLHINKDKGLNNNTVLGLFVDKEGSVWCALDNGIARVNLNTNLSFLSSFYNLGTGYIQDYIRNEWYFGTNQGLYKISDVDFSNPLKDRNSFKKVPDTKGQVWSLYDDGENILCGHNHGVIDVTTQPSKTITPSNINGILNFKSLPNDSSKLICGTYDGLILLSKSDGEWHFTLKIPGFNKNSRFTEWDQQGNLWVANGFEEVYRISFTKGFTKIREIRTHAKGTFGNSSYMKLLRIKNETIILGDKALFKVDKQGTVVAYDKIDTYLIKGQTPSMIKEDKYQNLWLFYSNSLEFLQYVNAKQYKRIVTPFISLQNKLVSNFESVFVKDLANIYFGVEDGFVQYRPNVKMLYDTPLKVHISSFKGKGDSIGHSFHYNRPITKHQLKSLEYSYGDNIFTVDYAATFYKDEFLEYTTFVSGIDQDYASWSTESKRQFTVVREGNYQFSVKARNKYGVESEVLTIPFKIKHPWYRGIFARIVYLLIFIIILSIIIYLINKRVEVSKRREHEKARMQFKEKEEAYSISVLQAEKEVVKMRNDKLRGEMHFKEQELANLTVHIIQKNDLLNELQDQLIRIKRINGQVELKRKIESLIVKIGKDIDNESTWQMMESQFEEVHHAFVQRLVSKHSDLTDKEKKLCAYIKMGMASKEISCLMNISIRSVENNRYKLRLKLGLKKGEDLSGYIANIK